MIFNANIAGSSTISADKVTVPDNTASLYGLENATVDEVLQVIPTRTKNGQESTFQKLITGRFI